MAATTSRAFDRTENMKCFFNFNDHQDNVRVGYDKKDLEREFYKGTVLQHGVVGQVPVDELRDIATKHPNWVNSVQTQSISHNVTPLIAATIMGRKDVVEMLLEKGAQMELKDIRGYRAVDHAHALKDEALIAVFKKALGKHFAVDPRVDEFTSPQEFYSAWR